MIMMNDPYILLVEKYVSPFFIHILQLCFFGLAKTKEQALIIWQRVVKVLLFSTFLSTAVDCCLCYSTTGEVK